MLVTGNFRMATDSIKNAKWRSFLTMLGIIIGVMSVVTIVSIGEGVKKQIVDQIGQLGPDLVTVRPGRTVTRDASGTVTGVNYASAFVGNSLSETDLDTVQKTPGVANAVPLGFVTGVPSAQQKQYPNATIFATTEDLPSALSKEVEYGSFFSKTDSSKDVAIIGKQVAEELFEETVPVGRSMQIRGHNFVVLGVFEEFKQTSIVPGADYNAAIFIPMEAGKKLSGGPLGIQQIFVRPAKDSTPSTVVGAVSTSLLNAHQGQEDFTILTQQDNLDIATDILDLLTRLISGVAAVSLLVGGIGIMNVMLVSVTERTREIGVRKSIGATSHQILSQFVIEAAVISFVGGIIGVIGSLVANFFIRIFTDLEPLITLPIMGLAVGVALLVGVIFGMAPALRAARKDPIEALRAIH